MLALLGAWSCSESDEHLPELPLPTISFTGYEEGAYSIKAGKSLEIIPVVTNAENPFYVWKMDGKTLSNELTYIFVSKVAGDYLLTFQLTSDNGYAEEDIKVKVLEKTPPEISMPVDNEGNIIAYIGKEIEIVPQVKYGEEAIYVWKLNGETVGSEKSYVFTGSEPEDYRITLTVTNEDGETSADATIRVMEKPLLVIGFQAESVSAPVGRPVCLAPYIDHATDNTTYLWKVDGVPQQDEAKPYFFFSPTSAQKQRGIVHADGSTEHKVTLTATEGDDVVTASVIVIIVPAEGTYRREPNASSSPGETVVFEFLPAPGQFANEAYTATTMDEANAYALKELKSSGYVSLGGFGGYIVVGFDHSIANVPGRKDFAVKGNSFTGSSEPGIVWVMQDENGDGLANDTWYELKGSEFGKPETVQNYAVTYFKPASAKMNVMWRDNRGKSGFVDYLGHYYGQGYYPNWVNTEFYTLRGTCLEPRNTHDPTSGSWYNGEYDWGYADNFGNDTTPGDGTPTLSGNHNYFDLSNAVYPDGTPANLKYVDFIKVQSGVNGKSGWLGEISTEVLGIIDLHIANR